MSGGWNDRLPGGSDYNRVSLSERYARCIETIGASKTVRAHLFPPGLPFLYHGEQWPFSALAYRAIPEYAALVHRALHVDRQYMDPAWVQEATDMKDRLDKIPGPE